MTSPENETTTSLASAKRLCQTLQSEDKRVRKQALIEFTQLITSSPPETHHEIFNESHLHLLNALRDKSEPVREQAIAFIKFFLVDVLPANDYYLAYLSPVLIERVGSVEVIEESEEIRLQLVELMRDIIGKFEVGQLKPFLNDFVIVLKETVKDKYPEIKNRSCKCIVELCKALPRDFHMQAESLVKPVLTAIAHQRYKIRIEAINCLGEIILHCTYKALDEALVPMAERLFDQIPVVRRAVANVATRWLLEYRDRYSFFHKLLPLILTGTIDEIPQTRLEACEWWNKIGLQYQQENEKDLKDQLDYLTAIPDHYPKEFERPNLGCRVLVQRSLGKLTAALARELVSWQADVRVRCSQLLCAIALHAEEDLTQHLQDLLMPMYSAARDEDVRVTENIVRASELMGVFVPVSTWMKLILPAIEAGPHYGHLMVLAAFIRGAPAANIWSSLREISQVLADKNFCYSRKKHYQTALISCVQAIGSKYNTELTSEIGQNMFIIIVSTLSTKHPDNEGITFQLLGDLYKTLGMEGEEALWRAHVGALLQIIRKDPRSWTEFTFERCIFDVILTRSGEAFSNHLEIIGGILVEALHNDVEAESRLKTFIALSEAFDMKDVIFKKADGLQEFLQKVLKDVIVPALVWHAGRTAEAMRTIAASCLCSALNPGLQVDLFTEKDTVREQFATLQPLLLSLCEDSSYKSRHLAMEDLVLLKDVLVDKSLWETDDLVKLYPEFLKRLDDPTEKVRICAIKSLKILLENAPDGFKTTTYRAHGELLLDTLMTHFDDEDVNFQDLVMDVLKEMTIINPKLLKEKVTRHKPLVRNQSGCDAILEYAEKI